MNKARLKFGMPTLYELPSLEEHFILAQKLGLHFIELNMTFPHFHLENLQVEKIQSFQKKYGIDLTIHLDENVNVGDFNQVIALVYVKSIIDTIHLAQTCGIHVLNMHMAESIKVSLPDRNILLCDEYIEDYLNRLFVFREACEKAIGQSDVKICIENLNGFQSFHKKGIDLLLESPVFRLTMDIGHDYITNHSDEKFIFDRSDRLCHFHIHDSTEKKCHLVLGNGEMDIVKYLELAQSIEASCVIETKTVQALTESVNWLKVKKWI